MIMLSDTYSFLHLTSRLMSGLFSMSEHGKSQLFQAKLYLQQVPTAVNSNNFLASSVGPSH